MRTVIKLTLCIIGCLLIGGVGGVSTAEGVNDWYVTLLKPSFNPPNYLFGPVWTILYLLMGISLFLILQTPKNEIKKKAIIYFGVQLFLNFCWSFLFFKFHLLGLAFVEIILIWISILLMIIVFQKINKIAAYIQIPYLLWVSFASLLNASIWFFN